MAYPPAEYFVKNNLFTWLLIIAAAVTIFFFKGCKTHSDMLKGDYPPSCKMILECGYYFGEKKAGLCIQGFSKDCSAANASKRCKASTEQLFSKIKDASEREKIAEFKACRNLGL